MHTNLYLSKVQAVREAFERAREQVFNDDGLIRIADAVAKPGSSGTGRTL